MTLAKCIREPRGEHGLEGYQLNSAYRVETFVTSGRVMYRLYPDSETSPEYAETATPAVFRRYFKQIIRPVTGASYESRSRV